MFNFGDTVTLHTRTGTSRDGDGNTVPSFTDSTVKGCAYDPGTSVELVQGQDLLTTQPTLYVPWGTDVQPVDQVTVRSVRYDVDGSPNPWSNPFTGTDFGVAVKLKAVTG